MCIKLVFFLNLTSCLNKCVQSLELCKYQLAMVHFLGSWEIVKRGFRSMS